MLAQHLRLCPNINPILGEGDELAVTAAFTANTRRQIKVVPTLGHRLQRWTNVAATLVERLVLAGN